MIVLALASSNIPMQYSLIPFFTALFIKMIRSFIIKKIEVILNKIDNS